MISAFGTDAWFPEVRSLGGAVLMLSFVLYPYVYLLARTAFLARTAAMMDAARSLGHTAWRTWWSVNLPLGRPAIVAGALLALMETIADYGTVAHFNVRTFSTGISTPRSPRPTMMASARSMMSSRCSSAENGYPIGH